MTKPKGATMKTPTEAGMVLELYDVKRAEWVITRVFNKLEKAMESMKFSAESFPAPESSRLRIRDMGTDAILTDKIVLRRPPREGEAHALFDTGSPDSFMKIAFDWHTVH